MAFHSFTAGERPTAAQWNDWVGRRVIADCTSSTRPASPVEGQVIYETDTDKFYAYDGSAWVEAGKLGGWTTYAPTWSTTGTPPAIGNGTVSGRYARMYGRTYLAEFFLQAGSTTTFGTGSFTFTLPNGLTSVNNAIGVAAVVDNSVGPWLAILQCSATATCLAYTNTSQTDARAAVVTGTSPMTWAVNDLLIGTLILESTS